VTAGGKLAYGLLGAPLAMAALPVYVYTPKLYGEEFGLGLALTGLILLLSRVVDTLQDPWLGRLADTLQRHQFGWKRLIGVAAVALAVAFIALFNPPQLSQSALMLWFGVTLVLVYTAHSAINITYLAWGARASLDPHERTQIVASREGFGLLGVILASLLPMGLGLWLEGTARWLAFSLAFAGLLLLASWVLYRHVPQPARKDADPQRRGLLQPLRHPPFLRLATLFLLNGLAIAIAATLSLFYIQDVLDLEAYSGALLAAYFISGALSLPLWLRLSRAFGKVRSWLLGSAIAVVAFVWATLLGAGDLGPYLVICLLSGSALGADLALPAAIAADIIPEQEQGNTAGYFGIWSLIAKAVLALAAGLSLPLLAGLGYQPGGGEGLLALALLYAGAPCLIKLLSAGLLLRWRHSLEVSHAS
jgi:GPH family glycoside/pentoside/hexuronide:cation symporter